MRMKSLILLSAFLSQTLLAGTEAEKQEEIRRMREKESGRAREAAKIFSNQEDFVKKYEQFKQSEPRLFADAMEKRQVAATAWGKVADGMNNVESSDQVSALKIPAYDAEAVAEIARLEMKAAASEKEWKRSLEKSESREMAAVTDQMIQNQKAIIQATKQQYSSQRLLRQLEIERAQLDKKKRDIYEKGKREEQEKREKMEKPSPREHENKPDNNGPGKILVE